MSLNPNAIELLKENENKIDWDHLSSNLNAIELLEKNKDKINWKFLSLNSNAIELLKENKNKINWKWLSLNSNIMTYDYKRMKETLKNSGIVEELMAYTFHPKNMDKWKDWGFLEHQEMLDFLNDFS